MTMLPDAQSLQPFTPAAILDEDIRSTWRRLDPEETSELREGIEAAIRQGILSQDVAEMLGSAHNELAQHKRLTRGMGAGVRCYRMTAIGGVLKHSRELALRQVELLARARQSGTIDDGTACRAQAALARELEMLSRGRAADLGAARDMLTSLVEQYKKKELQPGQVAIAAAGVIVQMEREP